MDYAGKIWIAICGGFILLVGVLSANGGLVWTGKALQSNQAKTRVIDMNAVPKDGANLMKYQPVRFYILTLLIQNYYAFC